MYILDLEKSIVDGRWEGEIGRVNRATIQIWTEPQLKGERIYNFYTSGSIDNTKLRVYGTDRTIYITYEKVTQVEEDTADIKPPLEPIKRDNVFIQDYIVQAILDRVNELEMKEGPPGRSLEIHWDGTKLGVRKEGEEEYVYVDLKGETGSIENLTEQHIINALGFTPLDENNLPDNFETTSGSQAKADVAESNAKSYVDVGLADKVDKVSGKGLSTNDYTTVEKNKLNGIQAGAQVNTVTSVAGRTGAVTVNKSDVGLSNVDNLSAASIRSGTTKANVGLSNVDNIKQMPISGGILENYREKLVTVSAADGSINLSLGNVFVHTPSGNRTYSITNAVNGQAHSFTLVVNMGSTVRTLTFPASVKWQGGEIPDLSTANKTYVLTFMTIDGGTTWLGMSGGEF